MQARLRALAANDVEALAAYYREEAGRETALDFVDALEAAISHLQQHPHSGSLQYAFELDIPALRNWPLQKFPYLIFYKVAENRIDIWRILHARRDIPAHLSSTPLD